MEQEQKRGPGRPRKHPKVPKYPMNPDPSIQRIRTLVTIALEETAKPFDKSDGGEWARLEGACEHALKEIAKELGVIV